MNNLSEIEFNVVIVSLSFTPHSVTNKFIHGAVLPDYLCPFVERHTQTKSEDTTIIQRTPN
jgi:hypothetical protein